MSDLAPRPTAHTRFAAIRARLEAIDPAPGPTAWIYEFLLFGFKQGWACLFGGLMLAMLLGTHLFWPTDAPIARYDALTIGAVAIQITMLLLRLETLSEAKVILAFHAVGTIMELFKTAYGSWTYPEPSLLRIGGVPLFSGFMYACVGSYIARVWRIFDFRFPHYPPAAWSYALAVAVYVNFFAHHWLPDVRLLLFAAMGLLFWRTRVIFRVWRENRSMPLLLPRGAVHLVGGEHRHFLTRVDLSQPGGRLDPCLPCKARRLVPSDVHLVRAGCGRAPGQITLKQSCPERFSTPHSAWAPGALARNRQ